MDMLLAVAAGVVLSVLTMLTELLDLKAILGKRRPERETLEHRIEHLTKALSESAGLISEMEEEIASRHNLVSKLEADLQTYNQLVEIKRSEVEAVAQLLRGELRSQEKRGLWQQVVVNFIFFLAGMAATLVLT